MQKASRKQTTPRHPDTALFYNLSDSVDHNANRDLQSQADL